MEKNDILDDDVVISGLSMWFPEMKNLEEFSTKLLSSLPIRTNKTETAALGYSGEIPEHRRLLKSPHYLDNNFFGIPAQVSQTMEHYTRTLFAKIFEAVLDAGLTLKEVQEIACDMYVNDVISECDIGPISPTIREPYAVTGMCRAMAANRVSFFLNAHGTSQSLDCGLLGGMEALELATRAIRSGRADMAVVASGSVTSDQTVTQQYNDLGWLSMDGKTRVFDNDASGYCRSEGVAALILQRAKDAKRIYAKVRHVKTTAYNEPPYIKPTEEDWRHALSEFYEESGINKNDICYLEAYGSGVKEMDAAELNAVTSVFCSDRKTPLLVGSVKSNIGHLEGGSDLASVMKAITCFETGIIPKNADYSLPNALVPGLFNGKIQVVQDATPIPQHGLIAISGWTFSGVYGHLVLERYHKTKSTSEATIPRLVPVAARTDTFLQNIFHQLEEKPYDQEYLHLITDLFRRKIHGFLGRGYVILPKKQNSICHGQALDETKRPMWFVFSGMGSQWLGMGKAVMDIPITRKSIEKSHRTLLTQGLDLTHIITTEDPTIFDNIIHCFVGIAAVQIALIDLMRVLKITPDGIIGHSVGELACAYVDGCLTAEQMILAAYYRGKASMEAELERGFMAAVGMGYKEIKDDLPQNVEVACHNSRSSCTLSGRAQDVKTYVDKLQADGLFARTVNVANIAYHSTFIKPAAPLLLKYLSALIPNPLPRSSKWVSSSVPESKWSSDLCSHCSAEYQTNNLLSPVLFEEASEHIPKHAVVVEIAPHGLLQAILKRSLGPNVVNIPLTNRSAKDHTVHLLEAIGKIYIQGFEIDVNSLYPEVKYPVARGTGQLQPLLHWVENGVPRNHFEAAQKLALNTKQELYLCDATMSGYNFSGSSLLPVSLYIGLMKKLYGQYQRNYIADKIPLSYRNMRIADPGILSTEHDEFVEGSILRGNSRFEIRTYKNDVAASGTIIPLENERFQVPTKCASIEDQIILTMDKEQIYRRFRKLGYFFPTTLQTLNSVKITSRGLEAHISGSCTSSQKIESLIQLYLLDKSWTSSDVIFLHFIQELSIIDVPPSDLALDVFYDRALGAVNCPGLYISGVKFKKLSSVSSPLFLDSIKCIPYNNPPFQFKREFIQLCCYLAKEFKKDHATVLELTDKKNSLAHEIEKNLPLAKVFVKEVTEKNETAGYDLVICPWNELEKIALNASKFILARGSSPVKIPVGFDQISTFPSKELTLLKKTIILNGEREFIPIPESTTELVTKLRKHKGKSTALVVGFVEPQEGIMRFQEITQSQVKKQIKWMFILDKNAPVFRVNDPMYQQQLEKGLQMNVLLDGEWHYVYNTPLDPTQSKCDNTEQLSVPGPKQISLSDSCKNMMETDHVSDAEFDHKFSRVFPQSWTDQESKTITIPYCLAYYSLAILGKVRKYDIVLVTDGLSIEGQATIAVALTMAKRVFATVASEEEVKYLADLFPKIDVNDIFFHSSKHFGIQLKLAAGTNNPDVVCNFLEDGFLTTCMDYAAPFARVFHFGQEDIAKNTIIGLGQFFRVKSLYAIKPTQIGQWTLADKEAIKQLMINGIQTGVVKRPNTIANRTRGAKIMPILTDETYKRHQLTSSGNQENRFIIDSSKAYVVTSEEPDSDLDISEWLARRGVKNLLLIQTLSKSREYQQKVQYLKLRWDINVHSIEDGNIEMMMSTHKIYAVIRAVLSKKELKYWDDNHLHNEILKSEDLKHLITISRREPTLKALKSMKNNYSDTNIVWDTDSDILQPTLQEMFSYIGENSLILVSDKQARTRKNYSSRLIRDVIPETMEAYHRLGASISLKKTFVELATAGLQSDIKHDVPPVFIIPGLEDDPEAVASHLVRHLLYPAFFANLSHLGSNTIPNTAAVLSLEMMRKQRQKVFNLVGLSTGCALAIETARQLEGQGYAVAILLVNDQTHGLQCGFKCKEEMESALLDALCETNAVVMDHLNLAWIARMNDVVNSLDLPPGLYHQLRETVKAVRDALSETLDYKFENVKLKGPLTVVRSITSGYTYNYNKMSLNNKVLDYELSHKELLTSNELTAVMQKFIICEAMSSKDINRCAWPDFEELLKIRAEITNA